MQNSFTVATIADLHLNAFKVNDIYNEIQNCLFKYLNENKVDMIVFAGDFYDSIISHNSRPAQLSMLIIKTILSIAKNKGIRYIRIIKGTDSHDNNQLSNFKIFEDVTEVDLKVIETCTKEEIEGVKILYIPEEYMTDPKEYYKDFFNETYDMIFGHGMFRETSFQAQKQTGAVTLSKAPVFNSTELLSICDGPIIFGHIHIKCTIKERIFYVGSFSRHVFGEEEEKGFLVTLFNKETKEFINQFIENELSPRYDTFKVLDISSYYNNPETLIKYIEGFKKDKVRIQIIVENNDRECSYTIGVVS